MDRDPELLNRSSILYWFASAPLDRPIEPTDRIRDGADPFTQVLDKREVRSRDGFQLKLSESVKPWVNYKVMPMKEHHHMRPGRRKGHSAGIFFFGFFFGFLLFIIGPKIVKRF